MDDLEQDQPLPVVSFDADLICRGPLHPEAILGIQLFNQSHYFEAHEALETAWRAEPGPIRDLYRGVLQVGVGYYHILRANYVGALKMFARSKPWLEPFGDACRGIDLKTFRQDYLSVERTVRQLGPERLHLFDPSLFKPVPLLDTFPPEIF